MQLKSPSPYPYFHPTYTLSKTIKFKHIDFSLKHFIFDNLTPVNAKISGYVEESHLCLN